MPLHDCPKCKRKRRVIIKVEKDKGKKYWISRCIECKTPIKMDEYNTSKP